MLSTLFQIPHEIAGIPVFGFGWMLAAWLLTASSVLIWLVQKQGWNDDTRGYLPLFVLITVAIALLLPWIEERDVNGQPLGVSIRGYGVMVMLGVVSGVSLAAWRAKQVGVEIDHIYNLALYLFVSGIAGARGFYVMQNWREFQRPTIFETLQEIAKFTQGGLVVYGAFLFAIPALIWFCRQRKLAIMNVADVIAPSMLIGLAFGRVGCFLNGCCFGGLCTLPVGVTFPDASPPYQHQVLTGELFGVRWDWQEREKELLVRRVEPNSPPHQAGLASGMRLVAINGIPTTGRWFDALAQVAAGGGRLEVTDTDHVARAWKISEPHARSLPVHPVQLYAAVEAALLCLVLWNFFPFRRREGEVFALLLLLHPIARFLQEMIRDDLTGIFGTPLTISQWISVALFLAGAALWVTLPRKLVGTNGAQEVRQIKKAE